MMYATQQSKDLANAEKIIKELTDAQVKIRNQMMTHQKFAELAVAMAADAIEIGKPLAAEVKSAAQDLADRCKKAHEAFS